MAAQIKTFTYLFGSMLDKLVLKHTDNLSRTLQHVSMSAAEGQQVTSMTVATLNSMTVATLNSMRSDDQFDLFLVRGHPQADSSSGEFPSTPKAHFKPVS